MVALSHAATGLYFIDTQDHPSYTRTSKKEVLININSTWDAEVTLGRCRHAIVVWATDETGLQSQIRFHLAAR